MIEVASSTSSSRATKRVITSSSLPSPICPWATPMRACGHELAQEASPSAWMERTRLCTKKTWPPRCELLLDGLLDLPGSNLSDEGADGAAVLGGVAMIDMSRTPSHGSCAACAGWEWR